MGGTFESWIRLRAQCVRDFSSWYYGFLNFFKFELSLSKVVRGTNQRSISRGCWLEVAASPLLAPSLGQSWAVSVSHWRGWKLALTWTLTAWASRVGDLHNHDRYHKEEVKRTDEPSILHPRFTSHCSIAYAGRSIHPEKASEAGLFQLQLAP